MIPEHFERFNGAPTHWCSNHQGKALREGGEWTVTNGGKARKFICARCVEVKKAKRETEK